MKCIRIEKRYSSITYHKEDNILIPNFKKNILCDGCEKFYPMDVFHNGVCNGCTLDLQDNEKPNGIPF